MFKGLIADLHDESMKLLCELSAIKPYCPNGTVVERYNIKSYKPGMNLKETFDVDPPIT